MQQMQQMQLGIEGILGLEGSFFAFSMHEH
jgi:hypothetical protein